MDRSNMKKETRITLVGGLSEYDLKLINLVFKISEASLDLKSLDYIPESNALKALARRLQKDIDPRSWMEYIAGNSNG